MNDCITTTKQSTTEPCAYFLGYTVCVQLWYQTTTQHNNPDSRVHGAKMGPTWGLSAPEGLHIGPMDLAIWVSTNCTCIMHEMYCGTSDLKSCLDSEVGICANSNEILTINS